MCPSLPMSVRSTMCGWRRREVSCASRKKRWRAPGMAATPGASVLTATRLPISVWTASYTAPMPPEPSRRTTLYLPSRVPAGRVISSSGATGTFESSMKCLF
jgi:hypothetical protein